MIPVLSRLVMMGTGTFAEPTLRALIEGGRNVVGLVTQPDRAVGDKRGSTRQVGDGMKQIALAHGIPVFQPESINTSEGVAGLKQMRPDLLVVAAYGQILSREVLEAAPHGGINVHASLLPKYRGAAPVAWAIYHGEAQSGVTIIRMSTALDAGDMLGQEAIDILPDENAGELEARLSPLGARLAVHVIDQMIVRTLTGMKQDKALVTKAPKLTKELGLIDWSRPAPGVANQIRAMSPWPTAHTYLHSSGQPPLRLIIHKACARPDALAEVPGIAVAAASNSLLVGTGAGSVEILELQPAGKRRMTASDFLRGRPLRAGDRLGGETA